MVVVCPKGCIALGTLPLSRFVSSTEAVKTKYVETFGQDGVLTRHFAARASQRVFVLSQLLPKHFIRRSGCFYLLQSLYSSL